MSVAAWVLWFGAQTLVLLVVLGIAMLGVTGRLAHSKAARPSTGQVPRHGHHLHLAFWHHAAH